MTALPPVTQPRRKRHANRTALGTALLVLAGCLPGAVLAEAGGDRHYNEAGFFDIHVCNWPDRPPFFMLVFSTFEPDAIDRIEVITPGDRPLAVIDKSRYRTLEQKDKPDKRVFINQVDIPDSSVSGWYAAHITLTDGREFKARDYVNISRLPQTTGQIPSNESEVELPRSLQWEPVPGAGYYQVFIRDLWQDGELIYTSKLLDRPELALPEGLLKPGGYYSWIVHARDTNEDAQLGDFNHGSLNKPATFSVTP